MTSPFFTSAAAAVFAVLSLAGCGSPVSAPSDKAAVKAQPAAGKDHSSQARRRLITEEQYLNTIAHMFGPDIEVIAQFAPMQRTDGLLSVGAAQAGVPAGQMLKFQRAARQVAAQVVSNGNVALRIPSRQDALIPCKPADVTKADDACARMFLGDTARLLYRRPAPEGRVNQLVAEAAKAAMLSHNFYTGLAMVLEGMLLSPEVLFITDRTEPDPGRPGQQRLDSYAYASRLSLLLWNAFPDDRVLKAAESGELSTAKGRKRVVEMMLASPRLEEGMRAFFDDMLAFDSFASLSKDPTAYPGETGLTLTAAREQTLRTIYYLLVTKNLDYRDLFTTRTMLMSPVLGTIYGVPTAPGWQPYTFPPDSPRVGLLTQISFLAVNAHPARSSATRRGKALRELLLCQHVPLPPPNIDFSALEDPKSPAKTARDRLTVHRTNPVCAGCHRITDPIGLALENFDGAGQYRADEKGVPIDASGSLDGHNFRDAIGLGQALHDHPSLPSCLVRRAYGYAVGAPVKEGDTALVDHFTQQFAAGGYHLRDLLQTIVLSPAFYQVAPAPPETARPATSKEANAQTQSRAE